MGSKMILSLVLLALPVLAGEAFETDVIKTSSGDLQISFIGHGTLLFSFDGKIIHIDPWSKLADYSKMPEADLILITHEHADHLDAEAIKTLRKEGTEVIANRTSADRLPGSLVMNNGDVKSILGIKIEAVPAYNIIHMRSPGQPFHPKGNGNGYVLTFGDKRIYVAGDTVADAAKAIKPKILYPYHFGETDTSRIVELLKETEIEVRIRKMK
jgi:hypothetical protein